MSTASEYSTLYLYSYKLRRKGYVESPFAGRMKLVFIDRLRQALLSEICRDDLIVV